MIIAVKIQNRQIKEFYCKGEGFRKIGKTWATLKKYFIECYKEELNSDFLVITNKGTYTIPVASYFIDYLTREHELDIVSDIKKFCKKKCIKLA